MPVDYADANALANDIIAMANDLPGNDVTTVKAALEKVMTVTMGAANGEVSAALVESASLPPLEGGDPYTIQQSVQAYTTTVLQSGQGLADQQAAIDMAAFTNQVQNLALTADGIDGVVGTIGGGGHVDTLVLSLNGEPIRTIDLSIPTLTNAFVNNAKEALLADLQDFINVAAGLTQTPAGGGIGVGTII